MSEGKRKQRDDLPEIMMLVGARITNLFALSANKFRALSESWED